MTSESDVDNDVDAELEDKDPWQTRKPIEPEDSLGVLVALLLLSFALYGAVLAVKHLVS